MRSRNIKPSFFKNEDMGGLPPIARLLFIGLWCLADREGRLEDRPKRIKAELFPYDNVNIDDMLNKLAAARFIIRYRAMEKLPAQSDIASGAAEILPANDGIRSEAVDNRYIVIPKFKIHQNPHKNEAASILPAPGNFDTIREDSASAPADSLLLIPDSLLLIPDVLDSLQNQKRESLAHTREVFAHWQKTMDRTTTTFSPERKASIERALKAIDVDQCKQAIDGCSLTDWNMGRDPKSNGRKYNDLTLILRNAEHWERFIETAKGSNGKPPSRTFTPDEEAIITNSLALYDTDWQGAFDASQNDELWVEVMRRKKA
jgi:hypothetical protein